MKALLAATVGLVFLTGAQDDDAAVKKEKELLKGTWKITTFETQQGKKDDFEGATMEFKADGNAEFTKGGETKQATYKINPAGKPKEIDIKPEGKDEAMLGIYRLEKDTLTICIVENPNTGRPNEFAAKDAYVVVTLKREKK